MKKKVITVIMMLSLMATTLVGCGSDKMEEIENKVEDLVTTDDGVGDLEGEVYYLNSKMELDMQWQEIADLYTEETGAAITIVSDETGMYDDRLAAELEGEKVPSLFQINDQNGYERYQDHCVDLSETDLYRWLLKEEYAITGEDGGVYAIPYLIEGYGIIYNQAIMEEYFALDGAVVESVDEIRSFDTLREVVEDMTDNIEELSIEGVFASTSLTTGEDWRWHTQLANIPINHEYREHEMADSDQFEFSYGDHYRNIFDLYIHNSITEPSVLGTKTVADSMEEFALGKVAMVQNGSWGWNHVNEIEGNVVQDEHVKFMPIYMGLEGEENQGLALGTENYFCINKNASEADQAATIAFLEWLYGTKTGKDAITNKLGFVAPFSTFTEEERSTDPLAREMLRYMEDETKVNMGWNFNSFSSEEFNEEFGASLLKYANGGMEWEDLKQSVVDLLGLDRFMEN